jgi:hypothetical protein
MKGAFMSRMSMVSLALVWAFLSGCASEQVTQEPDTGQKKENIQHIETDTSAWKVHDDDRPTPPVITPPDEVGGPPSDAIVLFDGTDLSQWRAGDGKSPAKWIIRDGYMEAVKGSGPVKTAQEFGSCQLHVEFATPANVKGNGQGRGNSGVFLQGQYEVQVLDSYENKTYADGQCSALYGRAVPLVNVCRKPGQWQSYDIIYFRPIFNEQKEVTRKAAFTVLQNGVAVQAHEALEGGTDWRGRHAVSDYAYHADKGPISLQDHGNPVRYRNVWIRELAD